jgi:DNA-binding transcriptional MerR regulator
MEKAMYIRDVAASAGLTPQAIRFYEKLGLIEKPQRTSGGYRVFSVETVERIRFIKDAQRLGFSLDEIREVLRLKYSGQSPCECVRRMLSRKLKELRDKIRQMDQMQREISACLQPSRKRVRLPHAASLIRPIVQGERPLAIMQEDAE